MTVNRKSRSTPRPFIGQTDFGRLFLPAIIAILLVTMAVRFIHLDADPVPWFTDEVGYRIDEGYKTLAPRNLVLFGSTSWHPQDEYRGWMKNSAVTQWPYYWSFRAFGLQLRSARIISIVFFGVFIAVAAKFFWQRYAPHLAAFGVLLIAVDPGLFFFSRSALFEISITAFIYLALFLCVWLSMKLPDRYRSVSPMVMGLLTIPAYFFLKKSIIIYMAPMIAALALPVLRTQASKYSAIALWGSIMLVLGGLAAFIVVREPWVITRLDLGYLLRKPQALFLNPIHMLSPVAMILAYGILLEMLLRRAGSIFDDPYRFCLAAILVLAPVGFALFRYDPSRYYLPIVPAAFLLCIERLALFTTAESGYKIQWRSPQGIFSLFVFGFFGMSLWASINEYILQNLPIRLGADPGLSVPMLLKTYPLFLIVLGIAAILYTRRFKTSLNRPVILSLAAFHVIAGLFFIAIGLSHPSYRSKEIIRKISHVADEDSTIGGDWIPFFAANTEYRVLYMRPDRNSAERIEILRPDYYLYSDTHYDRRNFIKLKQMETIQLGRPVSLGRYGGQPIVLFPITYLE